MASLLGTLLGLGTSGNRQTKFQPPRVYVPMGKTGKKKSKPSNNEHDSGGSRVIRKIIVREGPDFSPTWKEL